jgi:hypothetical protein
METDTSVVEKHAAPIFRFVCVCPRESQGDTVKRNVRACADKIKICDPQCI